MRGVGMPTHTYAQIANQLMFGGPQESGAELHKRMKKVTRAYSRVVLRLRGQAEAEAEAVGTARRAMVSPSTERVGRHHNQGPPPAWSSGAASQSPRRMMSRQSSRAPSPTNSAWSHSNAHGMSSTDHGSSSTSRFASPLFRPRRAPLLRVFVPSLEGDWLSDAAIVECENELRKAGVAQLMRPGDVVWDIAVGDEGNVGRLIWDGLYLIDLDYTHSPIGDLPPALPTLAFAPSYFHRVVRIAGDKNPICHIDVAFWAAEIAANLQLLQDRVKTETPQGGYHTVVRWVHRSSFTIRHAYPPNAPVLVLPSKEQRMVDPGWYGTVVVEAEGTNEGLADLQQRCKGGFPPRATPGHALMKGARESMVWRILRERSRPGEIWIRAVSYKERLAP
ncbi:hypothetical protein OF83DRAFT_1060098 [Amylostereum chailletii]|nr:hypothetical protein OF83DRAFT_1060098 [Amylostereum chailletii]